MFVMQIPTSGRCVNEWMEALELINQPLLCIEIVPFLYERLVNIVGFVMEF